jgi:hypothetical protein
MIRLKNIAMLLGLFYMGTALSQNKNEISFSFSSPYYFFDKNPILINLINPYTLKLQLKKDMFIGSIGIGYTRHINEISSLKLSVNSLNAQYHKNYDYSIPTPSIAARLGQTINLTYIRNFKSINNVEFNYSFGINYSLGVEGVTVSKVKLNNNITEGHDISIKRSNIGIISSLGLNYHLIKRIYFSTDFNLVYFIYLKEKEKYKLYPQIYTNFLPGRKNAFLRISLSKRF